MKELVIGLISAGLGLVAGAGLMFGANYLASASGGANLPTPAAYVGQPDISVALSATFLNAQMQPAVKQLKGVRQATLTLAAPDSVRVVMLADVVVGGQSIAVNATVSTRVAVKNGRIVLTIDRVDTGGVSVPQAIVTQMTEQMRVQMEDQLNRAMQRTLQGLVLRLVNINVTPTELTLQFKS